MARLESKGLLFLSSEPAATERIGECLGSRLFGGVVIGLVGELGGGKTTLVRGLARGLGITDPVSSPTFALMHEYRASEERGLALYHFDAWMEGRESLFLEGGGAEYFSAEGVCVVEWSERVLDYLPAPRLEMSFEHRSPEQRSMRLRLIESETEAHGAGKSRGPGTQGAPESTLARRLRELLEAVARDLASEPGLELQGQESDAKRALEGPEKQVSD